MPSPHCGPRYFIVAVVMLVRFACAFRRIRATADTDLRPAEGRAPDEGVRHYLLMPGDEIPYVEESSDALGAAAARTWQYRYQPADDPDTVVLTGPCPKCGHTFVYDWPLVLVREDFAAPGERETVARGDTAADATHPVTVVCRCSVVHPQADGERGCGRSWTLLLSRPQ